MDRYIVREPRSVSDYTTGNQSLAFKATAPRNNSAMIPQETIYFGGYATECPSMVREPMQPPGYPMNPGYAGNLGMQQYMNTGNYAVNEFMEQFHPVPHQAQTMSGIDPRYLTAYSDNAASFITTGQQPNMTEESARVPLNYGGDYENRVFTAPDRSKAMTFMPQGPNVPENFKQQYDNAQLYVTTSGLPHNKMKMHNREQLIQKPSTSNQAPLKPSTEGVLKEELQIKPLTRSDKLKALYKSGIRAFSGPVEKVLKWHKSLQEIGVLVMYEIVGKCVSVRQGDSCSKNLVVRDDNGPAMQVVYYEIDFLLPELKLPSTVRVIGRMMPGTSRLQAFNVRPATGDDVAMLPRRAAVAAHHVAKLCKEYGISI